MLQLKNVHKTYKTAGFTQTALDGVSITFRDNEFAAVLGPSGSGKTTMLNIIGGLDHYDSGDLEIDGTSTKKYKDSDWDTYRNNRIGFVFQSYNLIPHQTILTNVELALTLSGVGVDERKKRAKEALQQVGLGEHINKRPNQLSGGQMQRVAIARALINDPEILLADEPTGALDSKTGIQVMNLLQEIAKDRLVIMVTHNPELAEEYANRIVNLTDGVVTSDSRPFSPEQEEKRESRASRKAKMSFLTAISLSFSNLMTKKGRTFVTSLAGSIGIIGIAAILSLANGINAYITNIEQETMSIYPLSIQQAGFDLTSIFPGENTDTEESSAETSSETSSSEEGNNVRVMNMVETMFSMQSQNDLGALKEYIENNRDRLDPYVHTVQYRFDITPQIYLADTENGVDQVNPDDILSSFGLGADGGMGAMASSFGLGGSGMNVFSQMPEERSMFEHQYDMVEGRWPESHDEAILVLTQNGGISDLVLYGMGVRDRSQLSSMIENVINNSDEEVEVSGDVVENLPVEELMNAEFRVINPADRFQFDEQFDVWVDKSNDDAFMRSVVEEGLPMNIVGIIQPKEGVTTTTLAPGVNFTSDLIDYLMAQAKDTEVVQKQLDEPKVNVLTGKTFAEEKEEREESAFNFTDVITINEEAITDAFQFDTSKINLDLSSLGNLSMDMSAFDLSGLDMSDLNLPPLDMSSIDLSGIDMSGVETPELDMNALTQAVAGAVNVDPQAISGILSGVMAGFISEIDLTSPPEDLAAALDAYLARPDVQASIAAQLSGLVDPTQLQTEISTALESYMQEAMQAYMAQISTAVGAQLQTVMQTYMNQVMETMQTQIDTQIQTLLTTQLMPQLQSQIESSMQSAMAQLPEQIQNAITIDQEAFANAFEMNMSENEVLNLMQTLMNPQDSTLERNLSLLGYADPEVPTQIDIFPLDFSSKDEVENFLTGYNEQMEANGTPEKVIRYTDIVGAMMSSVTSIVNMISTALIAFVAISLVVSSIMIGVITYISVLERKKEIGILRAMGASKKDIRRVFNAETLLIGLVAGLLGVGVTALLTIPANIIVNNRFGVERIAQLPWDAAFVLIAISMFLAFIAGLFPSSAAARKDPVEALRSE